MMLVLGRLIIAILGLALLWLVLFGLDHLLYKYLDVNTSRFFGVYILAFLASIGVLWTTIVGAIRENDAEKFGARALPIPAYMYLGRLPEHRNNSNDLREPTWCAAFVSSSTVRICATSAPLLDYSGEFWSTIGRELTSWSTSSLRGIEIAVRDPAESAQLEKQKLAGDVLHNWTIGKVFKVTQTSMFIEATVWFHLVDERGEYSELFGIPHRVPPSGNGLSLISGILPDGVVSSIWSVGETTFEVVETGASFAGDASIRHAAPRARKLVDSVLSEIKAARTG
jgi:hypothetical protein